MAIPRNSDENYANINTWAELCCFEVQVTSVPLSRKTHRAGKYERYFEFKWLRFCTHIDVYRTSV